MKFSFSIIALLAATTASAAEMKACRQTNMNGACGSETALGKTSGRWKSYVWDSSSGRCVRVCNGCTSLGYRCKDYSNNNISFNKFVIFAWTDEESPGKATCC